MISLLVIILLCISQIGLSAPPSGSYIHYDRNNHCGGVFFGDGTGLPRGDFTISYWLKFEGLSGVAVILDGNLNLDIFAFYPMVDLGYINYWNFGDGKSVKTEAMDYDPLKAQDWKMYTCTYDRAADIVSFYVDGDLKHTVENNNDADANWQTGDMIYDFGHFGRVSNSNLKGIEAISLGCRSQQGAEYSTLRGGLDDFAIYNGVLSLSEVKSLYDDTSPFDPSSDDRLALYYSFDDPSSDTVINEAPSTSGLYPLVLGADRIKAEEMADPSYVEDTCGVEEYLPPVFVCHSYATCTGISSPSKAPVVNPSIPTIQCSLEGELIYPLISPFAYDPDGQGLTYEIRSLPAHGELYEENQQYRVPEADRKSTLIDLASLPYRQTEFIDPFFRYVHNPSDLYNIEKSDSFVVAYSDGTSEVEVTIPISIIAFNAEPSALNVATAYTINEDNSQTHNLNFVDYDSKLFSIIVDELPTNGFLTYDDGDQTKTIQPFSQFNPYGSQTPLVQYAKSVVAFSSGWYNERGDWGPQQILGDSTIDVYADSILAWSPTSMSGMINTTNADNEEGREEFWAPLINLKKFGYSEYIEVEFEKPVYISDIAINQVRGCGSIVNVIAKGSDGLEMDIYKGEPDLDCDAPDGKARMTKTADIFSPSTLCNTAFLANKIRIEMDTVSVADFNELDYVRLTGYEGRPAGVLPQGTTEVTYNPDPNFFGQDKFSFFASDCGYHADRVSDVATVVMNVTGEPDPPVLQRIDLEVAPGNATMVIDINEFVDNLDGETLTVEFITLPSLGSLLVQEGGGRVSLNEQYNLSTTTFSFTISDFPKKDTGVVAKFQVKDASQDLSSTQFLEIMIQGVPVESGFPLETVLIVGGVALSIIGCLGVYTKGLHSREALVEKMLTTVRKENIELHKNLKMLKQYNNDEIDMIEAQITTFRADFGKKRTSQVGGAGNLAVGKGIEKLLIIAKELESEFVIGKGSFGEVHKSKYRGTDVAVKTLHEIDEESLTRFQAEILLMADLHHNNIVQLVGACWDKELMALVMEFCDKGMSSEVCQAEGVNFTWDDPLLKWCMDVGRAMKYLHGVTYVDVKTDKLVSGVIHRDLKPDNCLVTETYTVKVADFGEARAFNENNTMTQVGTPLFIAPEIVRGDRYSTQADVFSFALTVLGWAIKGRESLLEYLFRQLMLTRNKHKPGDATMGEASLGKVSHNLINKNWRPSRMTMREAGMPECIADLLLICWLDDPDERPSFAEIMDYLEIECMEMILPGDGSDSPKRGEGSARTRRKSTTGTLKSKINKQKLAGEGGEGGAKKRAKAVEDSVKNALEAMGGEANRQQMDVAKNMLSAGILMGEMEKNGEYLDGIEGDTLIMKMSEDAEREGGMIETLEIAVRNLRQREEKRSEIAGV